MKAIGRKETILQNMTFMAIISAINIVISVLTTLLSSFIPLLAVLLIIVLPLSSTIVEVYCKDKYYPIYTIATIGLSLVVTLWNIEHTIFYLIPSIFTGYIFGLLIKKNVSAYYSIISASIVQTALTIATIPLLNLLYSDNMISLTLRFLNLEESNVAKTLVLSFIFIISLIQVGLSYFVIYEEMKKLDVEINSKLKIKALFICFSLIFALFGVGISFLNVGLGMALVFVSLYFALSSILVLLKDNYKSALLGLISSLILSIILFAVFYPLFEDPQAFIVLAIFPLILSLANLLVNFLNKKKSIGKINSTKE